MARRPPTSPPIRPDQPRFPVRFRHDLRVTSKVDKISGKKTYLIEDPASRESYNFGEEEYFLCQSMDGTVSAEDILQRFDRYFGEAMTEEALQQVGEHICSLGLAENVAVESKAILSEEKGPHRVEETAVSESDFEDEDSRVRDYHWSLGNPRRFFEAFLKIVLPLRPAVMALNWVLIPAVPIALYTFFSHYESVHRDLAAIGGELAYIGGLLLTLFTINIARATLEGLVCTYHGAKVLQFGIRAHAGCIPRFYVDRSRVRTLGRSAKLWIYATSPLLKLYIIAAGVLTWFIFQGTGTRLAALAAVLCHVAMIELVIVSMPIFKADGYRWIVTFFGLPPRVMDIALQVMVSFFTRKPVVTTISRRQQHLYVVYGIILILFWVVALLKVSTTIGRGLELTFPGIFGRATGPLIFSIVLFFVCRWGSTRFLKPFVPKEDRQKARATGTWPGKEAPEDASRPSEQKKNLRFKYGVLTVVALLLLLPYPYRPGGGIEILPPHQQQIQAPVSGRVEKVLFTGGDGTRIARGTLVAKMVFSEIDNAILVLQRQIDEKQAIVDREKSQLAKLLAGARPEEISQARAQLAEAGEEVNVATVEVKAAKVASIRAAEHLASIKTLFERGVSARLQYDDASAKAEVAAFEIERQQKNLAAKESARARAQAQLDLLLAGARSEDIDAARRAVEAAQAEQRRLQQQLAYAEKQQAESDLLMPFDGYLIDPHLNRKVGAYLRIGEVFASAQDNTEQLVVIMLPEYEAGAVKVGARAGIKLLAYSGDTLAGKVLSIEPASTQKPTATERVFQVLIEIQKPPMILKPGMTGYGKIDAGLQPLGLIMTRPLLRFFQVEVWSWLP
jgi:putative peptide zinc metalloprotease protein